jgi:hypothetical protein
MHTSPAVYLAGIAQGLKLPPCCSKTCTAVLRPLLQYDALSLAHLPAGAPALAWNSSGLASLPLQASGVGGAVPTLQYEGGRPFVSFNRVGRSSYSFLVSNAALTIPRDAQDPGVTIAVVARMSNTSDGGNMQAGSFESMFQCGASMPNAFFVARSMETNEIGLHYGHGTAPAWTAIVTQNTNAISGGWEVRGGSAACSAARNPVDAHVRQGG